MRPSSLASALAVIAAATPADAGRATLNIVLVLDGLRPDAITAEETPNLWGLRREGVDFINSHSVFPTVTRVNATAIATGTWPGRNGMVGNSIYVRAVDPRHAFSNDDHKILLRLDQVTGGGMVLTKSLGEILQERGKRLAAVSSGSTGSALLTNPRRPARDRRADRRLLGAGRRPALQPSATKCYDASGRRPARAAPANRRTPPSPGPSACCATTSCPTSSPTWSSTG